MEQAEQQNIKKICKVIGLYVKFMYNGSYVGRENNTSYYLHIQNFNKIHVYVNDNITKESMMTYDKYGVNTKNSFNTDHSNNKKLQEYMSSYNREVMMSEYVTIPKSRLRRLIITEVVAWGIAGFILLISLIR